MEIEIDSKKNNPLLKRTEVYFTVKHTGEKTPNREIIRSELADKLNSKKENVVLNVMKPGFGINETTGYAKIYSSLNNLKSLEKKHILKRNKLIEVKKDKKETKTSEKPVDQTSAPTITPEQSEIKTKETIENKKDESSKSTSNEEEKQIETKEQEKPNEKLEEKNEE